MEAISILLKAIIVLSALLVCIYYLATTDELIDERFASVIRRRGNDDEEGQKISAMMNETPFEHVNPIANPVGFNRTCKLPQLDPWDKTIISYFDPNANPMKDCEVTFERRSYLTSNGRLWITESKNGTRKGENCYYRCKDQVHDYELWMSNWTLIDRKQGAWPGCDIMDVYCWNGTDLTQNTTYKFEHIQVLEKGPIPYKPVKGAYDVHIVVLDATSMSHFLRAMPLTRHYIENELDAVIFPYLNKVGYNSRPNAYGFLMGEIPEAMSFNWQEQTGVENRGDILCKESVNNRTVFKDYQLKGYRTYHFGDSANGVFIYPGCTGFTKNEIDHSMRPFVMPFNGKRQYYDQELFDNVMWRRCTEHHEVLLSTLAKFMDRYKGQPKMSLSWLTYLNHDEMDDLFHADEFFRDWFDKNREKFANSFLFFMGDHGHNLDGVLRTIIGKVENKNPFFSLILPEKLRSNGDLLKQLRGNAAQLIVHYDIYATLMEILENSHKWTANTKFTNTPVYKHSRKELVGSSLFHSLKQPRNCDALKVPLVYCMCEQPFELTNNTHLNLRIAQLVVDRMNKDINNSAHGDKCLPLAVDDEGTSKLKMQIFEKEPDGRQLIRAELKVLPSGGLYDIFVEKNGDQLHLLADKFPRIDKYEQDAKCLPAIFLRNYCFCKSILEESTTTERTG